MRSRSHTYLSATCVHGECADPYAWRNDGTARVRGACAAPPAQKGPPPERRRRSTPGSPFSPLFSLFLPFIFLLLPRWPISRSECEEAAESEGAGPEGAGREGFPGAGPN